MLARSLVKEGGFDEDAVARAYAGWYRSGPFDMGSTTLAELGKSTLGSSDDLGTLIQLLISAAEPLEGNPRAGSIPAFGTI